ncbi:alpha/beta hydrolase [Sphingosinithalassobacter portus]|uniref:alpha/beta hydrolase n=1 Tax=Stakelama portus TaxID=2676234 RepID=UPI001379FF4F|nr:alpha/beta hydrolase [Sphingosinithalassobacter portus]
MPIYADGIEEYVAMFRAQPAAQDIAQMRLFGDLGGARFAEGLNPRVRRFDSQIAASRREIPVRIYDPGGTGARPAICYFHGGGFSLGSIESFDVIGAMLAEATGAVVASVEYRRLPDADYREAQADCDEAFAWLARQAGTLGVDPDRVMLAGDSAGALLAFTTAANMRDTHGDIPAGLLLFYGTFAMDAGSQDYVASDDPLLTGLRIRQYIALFQRCGGLAHHHAPIDRTDLAGLPPTHIVAAERDPLRAEAERMASRLAQAGVRTSLRIAPGMIHGFLRAVAVSAPAREELAEAAVAILPWLHPADSNSPLKGHILETG